MVVITKKYINLVLCLFLLCINIFNASGLEEEKGFYLTKNSEGIYEVASNNRNSSIKVYPIDNSEQLYKSENKLFMRIDTSRFYESEVINVDFSDYDDFIKKCEEKRVSQILMDDLNEINNKIKNNEIVLDYVLEIVKPLSNEGNSRGVTSTTKTYTGYNNKQYYQELLNCKGNSLEFNVKSVSSGWNQYCTKVFNAAAITLLNSGMDKITGNSWTLLSIFNQSTTNSIATSKSFVHTAKLLENKYRKYTHVMFNGEPIPGSVLDYTYDYCFMNFVNIPGESFKFTGETGKQTAKVKGYDKADEVAYKNYLLSPYCDYINKYELKNTADGTKVRVSSLY